MSSDSHHSFVFMKENWSCRDCICNLAGPLDITNAYGDSVLVVA